MKIENCALKPERDVVLSKALVKVAQYWQLSNKQLARCCGLSEASISRLKNGKYILDENTKSWQFALIFIRIFRGLDAYMGGHMENEKAWLRAYNHALKGVPIEMMQDIEGLIKVAHYIDYVRGHYT